MINSYHYHYHNYYLYHFFLIELKPAVSGYLILSFVLFCYISDAIQPYHIISIRHIRVVTIVYLLSYHCSYQYIKIVRAV